MSFFLRFNARRPIFQPHNKFVFSDFQTTFNNISFGCLLVVTEYTSEKSAKKSIQPMCATLSINVTGLVFGGLRLCRLYTVQTIRQIPVGI